MENKVLAVVVTYNRKALLLECIDALLAQDFSDLDILIVDNASTDGTGDAVAPYLDKIIYQNTGANLGGAGGFQFGLRFAAENGYDYAWIMDDDCIPYPDSLSTLFSATASLGRYGYVASKVMWTDGSLCNMNIPRDRELKSIDFSAYSTDLIPSGAATFVSVLFPVSVIREVGLPIKEFFIWADDLEYTRRISLRFPCYVIPSSVVLHKCSTNNGSNISTDEDARISRYNYAYRNEVYLYRREGISGIKHILLRTPYHIYKVLRFSPSKKGERIKIILFATLKGISFNPPIEYAK